MKIKDMYQRWEEKYSKMIIRCHVDNWMPGYDLVWPCYSIDFGRIVIVLN